MVNKRTYRTFDEAQEEYYRNHPNEIDGYLEVAFEEYAKDRCTPALLSQLRMIARVKGISAIAGETGITRNGIQKALSEQGNPKFENINAIMNSIGYNLMPQKQAAE
ncbi:MAG: addiction module antidote protein [Alphaproteobacteria bacterium]|nr:addiction module antidote protein [Alphaproteobacteria bacterium]